MSKEICDFCSDPTVVARYHAEDFVVDHLSTPSIVQQSLGDWAACKVCEIMIDANEWHMLAIRATNLFQEQHPDLIEVFPRDVLFNMYIRMFDALRQENFHKVNIDGSEIEVGL